VSALIHFDFDQPYFVHSGKEIWDFCVVKHDSLYHIYYINVDEGDDGAVSDNLGHATSADLVRWDVLAPAITTSSNTWENYGVWAPDVVWDDTGQRWVMAYTGVDSLNIQRACIAYSDDLYNWVKEASNPVFEPDSLSYYWTPTEPWSSYRDPFLYFENGEWNMLSSTKARYGVYPGYAKGVIHRVSSTDFINWTDRGIFFENDGDIPWRELESCQYFQQDGKHHLYFSEFNVGGVTFLCEDDMADWSMANKVIIDAGSAPEVDCFDGENLILGRWSAGYHPGTMVYFSHVRFDTLIYTTPDTPAVYKPHPLARQWDEYFGFSALGNPTFGDNPVERGEPSTGLIGNGFLGTREYYPGPLAGIGSPGASLGPGAEGQITSAPFTVNGDFIELMVGGGYYPQTCYVALLDAENDTIIFSETGEDQELMTARSWNVRAWQGKECKIRIVDAETGPYGWINVDEIREIVDKLSSVPTRTPVLAATASPNPFNPATEIRFQLTETASTWVSIHDLRGRKIWESDRRRLPVGEAVFKWQGTDNENHPVASGSYIYRINIDAQAVHTGKITLAK
jgi:sucrose-6-phosphate hydrolase SacC (GH32 family)